MTIEEKNLVGSRSAGIGGGILSVPPAVINLAVDGRVKKSDIDAGFIEVILEDLTNAPSSGEATLFVINPDASRTSIDSIQLAGAIPPLVFRVSAGNISESETPETLTEYQLFIEIRDQDNNEDDSTAPTLIKIGRTPPWGTKVPFDRGNVPPVTYVNAPANGILDEAWFTTNPTGLRCRVNTSYPRRHAQDFNRFYLSTTGLLPGTRTPTWEGVLDANGEFVVDIAKLRAFGSTALYQTNNITDVAGYTSKDSTPKKDLEIRLALPLVFSSLVVPAAGTDGNTTLTLKHFNPKPTNVMITLKRPTNGAPGALITVRANGEAVDSKPLPASGDLTFDLTYDVFDRLIGTSTGDVLAALTYTYQVAPAPAQNSNRITNVFFNKEYPGPALLDEPDLRSENLPPVEVTGDSGEPDHLVPGDFGKPVTFTFRKWQPDFGDDLTKTATVSFYYNNVFVGDTTIEPGQAFASIEVEFDKISVHGVGDKEAYCTIQYLGVDTVVIQKDPTPVVFEANEVKLIPHVARTYNTDKVISCPSFDVVGGARLWRVGVPKGQSSLPTGQSVTLQAQGYEDIAMTIAIGAPHTETKPVVSVTADLVFDMPFAFLKGLQGPIVALPGVPKFHYVYVWYETTIAGSPYKSPQVLHRVNVRNTSSLFCDGTK